MLANLPYVAEGDELEPEITLYEPAGALFAGQDGLDEIRRLIDCLDDVSFVALEVGAGRADVVSGVGARQADVVAAHLQRTDFRSIEVLGDLAGHERVVVAHR